MRGLLITTDRQGEASILRLSGSASMMELDRFSREADRIVAAKPPRVVVDMSGLEFLASLAVAQLVAMNKSIKLSGGKVVLAAPKPDVMGVLVRCNLLTIMPVAPSVEEAMTT